jgi:hypothetical protein
MRFVDRRNGNVPTILASGLAHKARAAAAEHFRSNDARARQSLHAFNTRLLTTRSVRVALSQLFADKCAFCESPVELSAGRVHHFRPMQGAVDAYQGSVSRQHYWWLAYAWENLYWTCRACTVSAGARFPVSGRRAAIGTTGEALEAERRLLLDPCSRKDFHATSLLFDELGHVSAGDELGATTIDTFSLNRDELIEQRAELLQEVKRTLAAGRSLQQALAPSRPYLTAVQQCFGVVRPRPGGPRRAGSTHPPPSTPAKAAPVLVSGIAIENFRAIRHLELSLPPLTDEGPWTMLLGENGAGKTSVLQAVALALMGRTARQRTGLSPEDVLHRNARHGAIVLDLHGSQEPRRLSFSAGEGFEASGDDAPVVIAGYGAHRTFGRASAVGNGPHIGNLFDAHAELSEARTWLLRRDRATFDAAARAIKRLLLDDGLVLRRVRGEVRFERASGDSFKLGQLSDGYRSMIGLAVDLMAFLVDRWGSLEAAEGIVAIDEIGIHLHPRWQMRVVHAFREAFPRLQFLVTTHDPLCLRGLRAGEVVVLRCIDDDVVAQTDLPDVSGLMVDQLLTSEFFGLSSTIDPALEDAFERYYALLALRDRTSGEQRRLDELQAFLAERRQLGFTRRERLALEAVDEMLALERHADPAAHGEMSRRTRRRLREIWAQNGL